MFAMVINCAIILSVGTKYLYVTQNTLGSIMAHTYLTTEELASHIKYDVRTIRESLKDSVLFEGVHYIRPFGGRKILYIWDRIEDEMLNGPSMDNIMKQVM